SDAATSVAPAFASDFAWLELGSRVTARTLWPRSSRPRATAPPCLPVDPVTTTVSSRAMFWVPFSCDRAPSDVSQVAGVAWHYASHVQDNRGRRRRALRTRGGAAELSGSCGCIGGAAFDGEPPDRRARARARHASPPAHDAPGGAHDRGQDVPARLQSSARGDPGSRARALDQLRGDGRTTARDGAGNARRGVSR